MERDCCLLLLATDHGSDLLGIHVKSSRLFSHKCLELLSWSWANAAGINLFQILAHATSMGWAATFTQELALKFFAGHLKKADQTDEISMSIPFRS